MARVNKAVQIVEAAINKMEWRDEYNIIIGMLNMAQRLDKLTFEERKELTAKLEDKYETLKQ